MMMTWVGRGSSAPKLASMFLKVGMTKVRRKELAGEEDEVLGGDLALRGAEELPQVEAARLLVDLEDDELLGAKAVHRLALLRGLEGPGDLLVVRAVGYVRLRPCSSMRKRSRALRVVRRATSSGLVSKTHATCSAISGIPRGSLRLPRLDCGGR